MNLSILLEELKISTLCWYPSSGLDLKPLYYFIDKDFVLNSDEDLANEQVLFDKVPDYFIYSDIYYNETNWPLNDVSSLGEFDGVSYYLNHIEDLFLNGQIIGKFLKVKVSKNQISKIQNLLFFFSDNALLLNDFILQENLELSFVINIRDGFSGNGGAEYSMKFLELLLSPLKCDYLVSDNIGRELKLNTDVLNHKNISSSLNSKNNKAVSLQGLKEWSWSEYGIFQGDALLFKIQRVL